MGGVGDDDAVGQDADALRVGGNGDGVVGTREFHGYSLFGQPVVIAGCDAGGLATIGWGI